MHDSCACGMCVDETHVVKMMKHLLMIQKFMLVKFMLLKLMLTKHKLIKTMWIKAMFKYVDENHVDRNHVDQKHVDRNHVDRNHVDQNNVDKNNVDKNHFRLHGCTCSVHPWQAIYDFKISMDYDFKTFPRCARPVPFMKVFITAFPFIQSLIKNFRAARGHFPL